MSSLVAGYQAVTDIIEVLETWDEIAYGKKPMIKRGWERKTENLQHNDYIYVSIREPELVNPFLHGDQYMHEVRVMLDLYTSVVTDTSRISEMANSVTKLLKDNSKMLGYVDWIITSAQDNSDVLERLYRYMIKVRVRRVITH